MNVVYSKNSYIKEATNMENVYSFASGLPTFDDAKKLFTRMINECENEFNRDNDFYAIMVNHTDEACSVDKSDLYIFSSYSDCCEILNKYEYSNNVSVELFIVTKNTKTHVKYKYFDGCCYSSFAGAKPENHYPDNQYARTLYDKSTTVHVLL